MDTVSMLAGAALIGLVLRDIFDTLFHPHGRGILSERLIRATWWTVRIFARARRDLLSVAGPLAFVFVIVSWVLGVVIGGALIIEPNAPEHFIAQAGQDDPRDLADAVYISFTNVTSLGYGDIVPTATGLKLLGPTQAAIGLAILSAAISWILSIYGVLRRSRSAAREIELLCSAESIDPSELSIVISHLIDLDIELRQFPIAYYFPSLDRGREIAFALEDLFTLLGEGAVARSSQAHRAREAASGLLTGVNERFLEGAGGNDDEIIRAWRKAHLWE